MENSKELEERCYDISPEQPMLLLERCSAIVKDDPQSMTDPPRFKAGADGTEPASFIPGKAAGKPAGL